MKYIKLLIIVMFLFVFSSCHEFQSITGYVFDYSTGKPIKGALVKFYSGNLSSSYKEKTYTTDDKGCYRINIRDRETANGDKCYIEIKKDGYVTLNDTFSIIKDNKLSIYLKEASREL